MRFFKKSTASDRLAISVASRIVQLPDTNSMYQLFVLRSLPFESRQVRWKTLPDPRRARAMEQ